MKAFIVCSVLSLIAVATAEPPVGKYLPPSSSYGAPSGFGGSAGGFGGSAGGFGGSAGGFGGAGGYQGAGGYSGKGSEGPSEPANYEFSYQVKDEYGNDFGHSESRQGEQAKGRYYVLLPDGRTQIVEYVADENGYQPQIKYEGQANAGGYNRGGYSGATGQGGYSGGAGQGGYTSGFGSTGSGFGGGAQGGSGSFGADGYRYK